MAMLVSSLMAGSLASSSTDILSEMVAASLIVAVSEMGEASSTLEQIQVTAPALTMAQNDELAHHRHWFSDTKTKGRRKT